MYLIDRKPRTLIDCGPNTRRAREALERGLADLGFSYRDIERVVITHAHADHFGQAARVLEESGASLVLHPLEWPKVQSGYRFFGERLEVFRLAGMPKGHIQMLSAADSIERRHILPLDEARPSFASDGDDLPFADGNMVLMHMPGHSPGHLCVYDPAERLYFSGDHLLRDITPNPLIEAKEGSGEHEHTLKQYLATLDRLYDLEIDLVLPAHGPFIEDHRVVIDLAREHHRQRAMLISRLLDGREMTVYELVREVFEDLHPTNLFLAVSEVLAHLDTLCDEGRVEVREKDGRWAFKAAVDMPAGPEGRG